MAKFEADNQIQTDHINQNVRYEPDPQAIDYLNQVINFRLGQTLDDVRSNAMILSGISRPIT